MVKIASWNINSVRLRMPQIERFLTEHAPDVLCLQEIKTVEPSFPHEAFERLGYRHRAVHGQKGYHGVATVSRIPFRDFSKHDWQDNGEARHVGVELLGSGQGVVLENVYIPAGGDIPDRALNAKFDHKLDFYEKLTAEMARRDPAARTVFAGDFNIAPGENDVWNHRHMLKVVSHTPIELETMAKLKQAGRFTDVVRTAVPDPEKLFSWWSYRAQDFRKSNRGLRLDHIWVTPGLQGALQARGAELSRVHDTVREWERPSDHAPVTADLVI
jgi:exodeoxyribonuclease-3